MKTFQENIMDSNMLEVMQLSVSQGGVASSILVVIKFFYICFSLIENGNYYKLRKKYLHSKGKQIKIKFIVNP